MKKELEDTLHEWLDIAKELGSHQMISDYIETKIAETALALKEASGHLLMGALAVLECKRADCE